MGYKTAVCFAVSAVAFAAVGEAFADPYLNRSYSGGGSGSSFSGGKFRSGSSTPYLRNFNRGPSFKTLNVGRGGGGSTRVVQQYKTIYIPVANPYPPAGNYRKAINRPVMKSRKY